MRRIKSLRQVVGRRLHFEHSGTEAWIAPAGDNKTQDWVIRHRDVVLGLRCAQAICTTDGRYVGWIENNELLELAGRVVSHLVLLGQSETILGPVPARRRCQPTRCGPADSLPARSWKPGADVFLLWLLAWIDGLDVAASIDAAEFVRAALNAYAP